MSEMQDYVREQLKGLGLDEGEREDVISEIAMHLELVVEDCCSERLTAEETRHQVESSFGDKSRLLKGIRRAKEGGMKERLWRMWVPALSVGFLAFESQMVILRFGGNLRTYTVDDAYYVYSWVWLFTVAGTGALGAWWSRREGGSVRERLVVAMAPWEMMAGLIPLTLPLEFLVQGIVNHALPYAFTHPKVLGAGFFWMFHPAIASFIGAIPFLFGQQGKSSEPSEPVTA